MIFTFRPVRIDHGNLFKQISKIGEELEEARTEWHRAMEDGRDPLKDVPTLIELVDTLHACETALRMYDSRLLDYAIAEVVRKNLDRGYYYE